MNLQQIQDRLQSIVTKLGVEGISVNISGKNTIVWMHTKKAAYNCYVGNKKLDRMETTLRKAILNCVAQSKQDDMKRVLPF